MVINEPGSIKMGDIVYIHYYGLARKAEVMRVTPIRVRVRFYNTRRKLIYAWRNYQRVAVPFQGHIRPKEKDSL